MAGAIGSGATRRATRVSLPDAGTVAAGWATLVAVATWAGSSTGPGDRRAPVDPTVPGWLWPIQVAAALSLVAGCWMTRRPRSAASAGLALIATGVLVPLWVGWSWLPSTVRVAALAAAPLTVAGTAVVVLRWRSHPPPLAVPLGRMVPGAAAASSLLLLLGYDPFTDPRCELICDDVPAVLGGVLTTRSATAIACLCAVAGAVVAAAGILRFRCAPHRLRVAGVAALAALAALWSIRGLTAGAAPPSGLERALAPLAAAAVGVVVCLQVTGTLRTRAAAARLTEQLSDPATIPATGRSLILATHFAAPPGETGWIDAQGLPARDPAAPHQHVVLSDRSGPVVRLAVTRGADELEVLSGFTPARRLAVRNAQLTAVAKANIAQVRAFQRRLVAVSDAERRRIERDLHDGAQQRLVSAAFHLKVARTQIGAAAAPPELDTADQHRAHRRGTHRRAGRARLHVRRPRHPDRRPADRRRRGPPRRRGGDGRLLHRRRRPRRHYRVLPGRPG